MADKNKSIVDKWREPDNLLLLECWSRDGYRYSDIAERIGVSPSALTIWRSKYPEIKKALEKGREIIDYKVENALLKSALGYETKEVKTYVGRPDKNGNRPIRTEELVKEIPPNVTACMAWLNNRKPEQWKRNRDNVLELNDNESNITVNIVRHKDSDNSKTDTKQSNNSSKALKKDSDKDITKSNSNSNNKKVKTKKDVTDVDEWPDDWENTDD